MRAPEFVAVGIYLDENNKRVPGKRPITRLHQSIDYANRDCDRLFYDEGCKMTYVGVVVKCHFNKVTRTWELPDGFTHDKEST